jgi:hypothetical protein
VRHRARLMEEDGGRRVEGLLEHSTYFVLFLKKNVFCACTTVNKMNIVTLCY